MKVSLGRRIPAALVVAAGLVAAYFVWRTGSDAAEALPSGSVQVATAQAPGAAPAGPGLQTAIPEPSLDGTTEPPGPDDYEEGHPLADVMHKVLANDHQLNAFMYYYNRPLLDEADKAKYRQLLSDKSVFASVEHDLLYPEETKADKAGNIKRLMKIDFLREALEWKDNPERAQLIAMIKEMLLADNYPADMTMDMRLSLSGNKMELYELLEEVAPDQAAAVVQASRGTRLEKLMAYIAGNIEARKRIEASAESQVAPPRAN
jgi:hypothetical protein